MGPGLEEKKNTTIKCRVKIKQMQKNKNSNTEHSVQQEDADAMLHRFVSFVPPLEREMKKGSDQRQTGESEKRRRELTMD